MGAVEGVFGGYQHGVISGAAGGAFWHANMGRPKNTIILPPLGKMDELIEFVMPYCPPEYTTHQQVVSVGIEYLANHPKRRDENIAELLPDAFEEAWPCKE